jgi:toxin ParE1/3/4
MKEFSVQLTEDAVRDLVEIVAYLNEQASPEIARRIVTELRALGESLKQFPHRGNVPRELERIGVRTYRQLVRKPYRMIYHVAGSGVSILLVADGRRDMDTLLQGRLLSR